MIRGSAARNDADVYAAGWLETERLRNRSNYLQACASRKARAVDLVSRPDVTIEEDPTNKITPINQRELGRKRTWSHAVSGCSFVLRLSRLRSASFVDLFERDALRRVYVILVNRSEGK